MNGRNGGGGRASRRRRRRRLATLTSLQEKAHKSELTAELEQLSRLEAAASLDTDRLKQDLRERVAEVKALPGRHTPQARQMLRKLVAGKIQMAPVADGRRRGYRFRGALTVERLLTGEGLEGLVRSWWPQRDSHSSLVWLLPFDGVVLWFWWFL